MNRNQRKVSANGMMVLMAVLANVIVLHNGFTTGGGWYWSLLITAPLFVYLLLQARRRGL